MAAKKMAIIATKGALDMAYPPLILASTAAAPFAMSSSRQPTPQRGPSVRNTFVAPRLPEP